MSVSIIVGDVHLGKGVSIGKPGIGNALNSRIVDQSRLLDWVLDQAEEHQADTLIFTGDIYEEPRPDYRLVDLFVKFLKKCEVNNIETHIISGNHDIKRTGSHYTSVLDVIASAEIPMTHIYKKITTINKDGVGFTLMPFRDRSSLGCKTNAEALNLIAGQIPFEAATIPDESDRVLVGHLAIDGSIFVGDESDNMANELMCPLHMFMDYDYVWMGHVHKPQARSQKPYIAHIGSLDISDFGETDHVKNIIIFDTSDPKRFKEIPVPSRPLRRVRFTVPVGFNPTEYVSNQIKTMHEARSFKNAIVRIEVKLPDADVDNVDRSAVEKMVYGLGAFYICGFSESRSVSVVPLSKQELMDNTIGPKDAVKLYAEQFEFKSDDAKSEYIRISHNIIEKYMCKTEK